MAVNSTVIPPDVMKAASIAGTSKDKKKKKKRKKNGGEKLPSAISAAEMVDRSFIVDSADWDEALDDLSFDDITASVFAAVKGKYGFMNNGYPSCRYYIYKLWPDKVVLKRSYDNRDGSDALFIMHTYTIEDGETTLDDGDEVQLGFFSSDSDDESLLVAVREIDALSIDDPGFAIDEQGDEKPKFPFLKKKAKKDDDDEDEDEDENEDEDEDEDEEKAKKPKFPFLKKKTKEGEVVREAALREEAVGLASQDFSEQFDCVVDKYSKIVEGKGGSYVIEGMAVLGPKSKNNRFYPKETRRAATKVFEGIRAYCNHTKKGEEDEPRIVQELIGVHRNVRFDERSDMLRSDLHLSPTQLVREYIIPHAKSNPGIIGNSISASGKIKDDGTVLEITKGRSIDLVAEPATTSGIYESMGNIGMRVRGNSMKGVPVMEKEITVKEILENTEVVDELRQHFREEFDIESDLTSLKEERDNLREVVAGYKLRDQVAATRAEIREMLAKSKLPEATKDDQELISILEGAKDADARSAIVARMEKMAEAALKESKKGDTPSLEREKDITEGKVDQGELSGKVYSMLRGRR
jgi:hypothetical protein